MKSFLAIMALALLALVPTAFADGHGHMDKAMDEMKPVKLVMFYSDTCGSCKILEPRVSDAMKAINGDALEVVKFDFSNKASIEATKKMATEKDVAAVLQSYGAKTGFAVLVDGQGNEVAKLTINHETTDIAEELAKSIVNNNNA